MVLGCLLGLFAIFGFSIVVVAEKRLYTTTADYGADLKIIEYVYEKPFYDLLSADLPSPYINKPTQYLSDEYPKTSSRCSGRRRRTRRLLRSPPLSQKRHPRHSLRGAPPNRLSHLTVQGILAFEASETWGSIHCPTASSRTISVQPTFIRPKAPSFRFIFLVQ